MTAFPGVVPYLRRERRTTDQIFRILVTGSRVWTDSTWVGNTLDLFLLFADRPGNLVVVHGGTDSGAEAIADDWVEEHVEYGVRKEVHQARWYGDCQSRCRPGHRRRDERGRSWCPDASLDMNSRMVASNPDVCVAFLGDGSATAVDCADKAERAGIPTFRLG